MGEACAARDIMSIAAAMVRLDRMRLVATRGMKDERKERRTFETSARCLVVTSCDQTSLCHVRLVQQSFVNSILHAPNMSAPTLNKSRKEKRRRLKEQVSIPLGDNQATHEYQYKGEEELRLESVLFGTSRAGGSSDTAGSKGKKPVNTSMSHLLDDEVSYMI